MQGKGSDSRVGHAKGGSPGSSSGPDAQLRFTALRCDIQLGAARFDRNASTGLALNHRAGHQTAPTSIPPPVSGLRDGEYHPAGSAWIARLNVRASFTVPEVNACQSRNGRGGPGLARDIRHTSHPAWAKTVHVHTGYLVQGARFLWLLWLTVLRESTSQLVDTFYRQTKPRCVLGTLGLKLDRWFSTVPDTDPGHEIVGHKTVNAPRKRLLLPTACTNPCHAATPPQAFGQGGPWPPSGAAANLSTPGRTSRAGKPQNVAGICGAVGI